MLLEKWLHLNVVTVLMLTLQVLWDGVLTALAGPPLPQMLDDQQHCDGDSQQVPPVQGQELPYCRGTGRKCFNYVVCFPTTIHST